MVQGQVGLVMYDEFMSMKKSEIKTIFKTKNWVVLVGRGERSKRRESSTEIQVFLFIYLNLIWGK
mgnify:CR=1 FL=1